MPETPDKPAPPPTDPDGRLRPPGKRERIAHRSATKAAIVSTVLGAFALARAIRAGQGDPVVLALDFGERMAETWLSAWLGITAAGKAGR